jgi:hypothetical protein
MHHPSFGHELRGKRVPDINGKEHFVDRKNKNGLLQLKTVNAFDN